MLDNYFIKFISNIYKIKLDNINNNNLLNRLNLIYLINNFKYDDECFYIEEREMTKVFDFNENNKIILYFSEFLDNVGLTKINNIENPEYLCYIIAFLFNLSIKSFIKSLFDREKIRTIIEKKSYELTNFHQLKIDNLINKFILDNKIFFQYKFLEFLSINCERDIQKVLIKDIKLYLNNLSRVKYFGLCLDDNLKEYIKLKLDYVLDLSEDKFVNLSLSTNKVVNILYFLNNNLKTEE